MVMLVAVMPGADAVLAPPPPDDEELDVPPPHAAATRARTDTIAPGAIHRLTPTRTRPCPVSPMIPSFTSESRRHRTPTGGGLSLSPGRNITVTVSLLTSPAAGRPLDAVRDHQHHRD